MRCSCVAKKAKRKEYHPVLKSVYERRGAKGLFIKIGYHCPNCGQWYNL